MISKTGFMMGFIFIFITLFTPTFMYNYSNIIHNHFLVCGPDYLCDLAYMNYTHLPDNSYKNIELCPECFCNSTCIINENCCPDVFFKMPEQTCIDSIILDSTYNEITAIFPMVTSCPYGSNDTEIELCAKNTSTVDRITTPHVTTTNIPLTYLNKHCASCHGQTTYHQWNLNISCYLFSDYNFLSTYQQVIDEAMKKECFIMHQIDTLPVRNCSQNEEIHFDKCNMTGMWDIFDPDIQYACESTYKLVYKVYKNIFCFICNPIRRINTTDVRTCNSTGSWKPFDQGLKDACQHYNNPENSFSSLNVFCYLCNRDNTFSNSFVDVNASITYTRKGDLTFYTLQNISDFSLPFYKQYLKDQMKITTGAANDKETKSFTLNLTNTLLKAYAYNPFLPGLCNEELLPLDALNVIKPITTPCRCNLSAIYEGNVPLCLDLVLTNPFMCMGNVISFGMSEKTEELVFAVVESCSQNFKSTLLRKRCTGNGYDIYSLLPVVDTVTNIQYKNFHCFICNQVTFMDDVDQVFYNDRYLFLFYINIICENDIDIVYDRYLSISDIILTAMLNKCRISLLKQNELPVECHRDGYNDIVHQCNVSGLLTEFDSDIKWSCENLSYAVLPQTIHKQTIFKNVFCSICNPPNVSGNIKSKCNETGTCQYLAENVTTGCLVFPKVIREIPYKNEFCHACNEQPCMTVFQVNETAIDTKTNLCFPPFEPFECQCLGSGCVAPIDIPGVKIRNLFQIGQTKTSDEPWDVQYCSDGQLYDKVEKNCRDITCFPGRHLIGGNCDPLFTVTRNIRYNLEVFIRNADSSEQFNGTEKIILRWLENIVRNHSIGITSMVILKSEIFSNFPCSLGQSNPNVFTYIAFDVFIESNIHRNGLEQSLLEIVHENSVFRDNKDIFSMEISLASAFSDLLRFVHMAREFKHESQCWKLEENTEILNKYGNYISTKINRQIVCPQFVFDADQYTIDGYSVLLIKYKKIINYDLFFMDSNNKIRICVDDFISLLFNRYIKSTTEYALEITTIVCTCVSLFCLLVTFITYCIFPILRTLPGKNNMCLIFSLLIAQTCLQFGTIWTDHIFICKAIGIILHVFWLATFACMNVCSYHMYSVFTTFRPTSSMSENNGLFLRYVCYSYGTPFVIVIINIAIQIVLSGGANIGYGGSNCFISDIPQIAAFICPVGVICLVNIWLFGFTAYTIYTRPIIRSTANDKQDFYVYIKLFSLTGITWIGQIVDSFIPLSVFSFVVTILTGLQGLFIFLSFVCNKRVYNLFLGMCKYNHSESVRESIRLYSLSEVNYHDKYIKRYPITKPSKIS